VAAVPDKHRRPTPGGKRQWLSALLLNLTFYPLMILWVLAGILAAPFCLLVGRLCTDWDLGRIMRRLISVHGRGVMLMVSPFVRFSGEGLEQVQRPCILVVNHLSFFDSYFMSRLPFYDVIFAVGAWPFKMYWYTLFMRLAGYLDVEQGDWQEALEAGTRCFAQQGSVLFFPEGHRSKNGELQPFHSGAFRLSQATGMPIVPLCLTGTDTLLPPGHFGLRPARVRLRALPPLDPADFPGPIGHFALRREVCARMTRALQEMQQASVPGQAPGSTGKPRLPWVPALSRAGLSRPSAPAEADVLSGRSAKGGACRTN
jgi:1-acyl-sn-glycerol-3-phosphate acyltransferase